MSQVALPRAAGGRLASAVVVIVAVVAGLAMALAKQRGPEYSLPYGVAIAGLAATPLATAGCVIAARLGRDRAHWWRLIHAMRLADQAGVPAIRRQLELASKELRDVAEARRPRALDDLGLGGALQWLADDMTDRGHVPVSLRRSGTLPELDPFVEVALFRIVQEAVGNAIRHAAPTSVLIGIRIAGSRVLLRIEDDGQGFDPGRVPAGLGLVGMRERAEAAGIALGIRSREGGTIAWTCHARGTYRGAR